MVMMNCAGSIVHAIKKHTIAGTRSPAVPSERQGLPKEPSAVGHQPSNDRATDAGRCTSAPARLNLWPT